MPFCRMDDLLIEARKKGYAIGAFECWNSDNIHALALAASRCNMPVILQASPAEYNLCGGADILRKIAEVYVEKYHIRAALHLDHGSTLDHVRECIDAGFTSVMLDASTLPFDENCELVRQTAELAHARGISVEAELGHVGGAAEGGIAAEESLTVPEEALRFVNKSKLDCLAIAIGTVHGEYRGAPFLQLERLAEIARLISLPLVLHGGSGTPPDQLKQAIKLGISKINICTDINKTYIRTIKETTLTPSVPGLFYRPAIEAVARHTEQFIRFFGGREA